jgi:hypothetical protein
MKAEDILEPPVTKEENIGSGTENCGGVYPTHPHFYLDL